MLFSATLSRLSRLVAAEYLNHPAEIEVTPEQLTVDTITQELYHVKSHIKLNLLLGLLKANAPRNVLIFANMRHHAFRLAKELEANGYGAHYLSGDLPQKDRLRVIHNFMAGKFPILVATDVAARGLHIDDLEMVINYDVPQDFENYVHRIGRTARAGASGKAITLASEGTGDHLEAIEKFIGMKIPVKPVTHDMFARDLSLEKMPKQGWGKGPRLAGDRSRRRPKSRTGRRDGAGRRHASGRP
jgi:ATP-dependent RNA helicase RhlB